jgi:hypothetical protein
LRGGCVLDLREDSNWFVDVAITYERFNSMVGDMARWTCGWARFRVGSSFLDPSVRMFLEQTATGRFLILRRNLENSIETPPLS